MDRAAIERMIGKGVDLQTKRGHPFRVTTSDYGFEYQISTGNVRRTAWVHTSRPGGPGLVELFNRWIAEGKPDSTTWVPAQDGVGRRTSSYVLATFQFLTRASGKGE